MAKHKSKQQVLITGASGYIGGRIIPILQKSGFHVIAGSRHPELLKSRFNDEVEHRFFDILEPESCHQALKNVDIAYYFVHSLKENKDFETLETQAAINFRSAAIKAGVSKIIYLGGLHQKTNPKELSKHLKSREMVGKILRNSPIPCIEFQASIIIGSGSISFEIIRSITEKLPIIFVSKWATQKTEPISIRSVLAYLCEAAHKTINKSEIYHLRW